MSELNKRIHVVINPASGQNQYILNTINSIFREFEISWDVSVTQKSGDARRFAENDSKDIPITQGSGYDRWFTEKATVGIAG